MRILGAPASALFFAGFVLAACGVLPVSGPESWDIRAGQKDPHSLPYALVRVTPKVVDILSNYLPRLANAFVDRRPPQSIRFGVGDILTVTIYEAAAGGLFIPAEAGVRPGNFITLPNQEVDSNGNISIPYAGNIRARGRTQVEVQKNIVDALKDRAIEPQAVVSLIDQRTSLISVLGDVNGPSRIPANHAGEFVLDAITRAGGPKSQGYDEWVMLEREGRRALAPFGALVYEPSNNIYVHPNDTIYVYREPQTFLAFGAVQAGLMGGQSQLPFDQWRLSLAEAIAKAGGTVDSAADASAVFLYRGETREVAEKLGIDTSKFQGPIVPVIYNLNLRDPAGYFLATKFEMRNKDVLYVANSVSVETSKVMNYFNLVVGTANDPITAALSVYALKSAIKGTPTATAILTTTTTATP